MTKPLSTRPSFPDFYAGPYREEHQHPVTIALHIAGTLSGLALLVASATVIAPLWALLFPVVHVLPGLIGHRLFERNDGVGDLRLTRTDFPLIWFVAANHRMVWDFVRARW